MLSNLPSETVDFSTLGKFKRSLQRVDFSKYLTYSDDQGTVVSAPRSLFCPCLTGCDCLLYRICIHACIVGHEKMRSGADLRGGSPLVIIIIIILFSYITENTFTGSTYRT